MSEKEITKTNQTASGEGLPAPDCYAALSEQDADILISHLTNQANEIAHYHDSFRSDMPIVVQDALMHYIKRLRKIAENF